MLVNKADSENVSGILANLKVELNESVQAAMMQHVGSD
jgi:hypothetical protein